MMTVVSATDVKNKFGEYMKRAYLRQEHLIVERDGIPVVAIVPISDYERIIPPNDTSDIANVLKISKKEELARKQLIKFLASQQKNIPDVKEKEAEKDIQKALRAVRKKK